MKSLAENQAAVAIAATEAIDAQMNLGALKYDPNDWRKESIVRASTCAGRITMALVVKRYFLGVFLAPGNGNNQDMLSRGLM